MIEGKAKMPESVGIIMDGNGRWAKGKGVPRLAGHNAGMASMKKIVIASSNTEEVSGIFNLIVKYVKSELAELIENNVHINILGDYSMLPEASVKSIDKLVSETENCSGMNFNIALNYGGRDEIVRAVNEIIADREFTDEPGISRAVTEDEISAHLYTGSLHNDIPDPDLIIRTSGEERLSNFLIWQSAYSELMFTDTLWPDFTPEEYEKMLEAYTHRKRRFGGREKEDK